LLEAPNRASWISDVSHCVANALKHYYAKLTLFDQFQTDSTGFSAKKLNRLILLGLFYNYSGDLTLFKRHGYTGTHGVSCFNHLRPIGPPLNPLECGFV